MKTKKNIILLMTDQQRYDALGCMGNSIIKTPNIDKLASQSQLFREAYCSAPLCVPSRVSLFTAQYVCKNRCTSNAVDKHIGLDTGSFFIEKLKEQGYRIGLAGKNHTFRDEYFEKYFDYREEYGHFGKISGRITDADRDVIKYRHSEKRKEFKPMKDRGMKSTILGEGLINEPEPFEEEKCVTWRIAEDAVEFIEDNRDEPFFLYCSFPDPHWPTVVCEPYYSMYNPEDVTLEGMEIDWSNHPFAHFVQSQVNGFADYTEEQKKKTVAVYYGMITYIDKAIGHILDKLHQFELVEETIVVFCSDHGDYAGRYGMVAKTKAFYDPLVRIPLMIRIPGMNQKADVNAQVSNIDIFPTILDYLGMENPEYIDGKSFLEVMEGKKKTHREAIFAEVGKTEMPPKPIPVENFRQYKAERDEKEGWFWFCDYTTKGRAVMIKKDSWKYCYYVGDRDELYNLQEDPYELTNLSDNPECRDIKDKLRDLLFEWMLTTSVQ